MIDDSSGGLDGVTGSLACPRAIQDGTTPIAVIRELLEDITPVDALGMKQANSDYLNLIEFVDSRRIKRRRNPESSYASDTLCRRFREGVPVHFASTNSGKDCNLQPTKISQFLDSTAHGAVKKVRAKKFRNLIAVNAQTPRLKAVLLEQTCSAQHLFGSSCHVKKISVLC